MGTGEARLVPVTEGHLEEVARTMRPEDIAECAAMQGMGALETLTHSLRHSRLSYAMVLEDGRPLGLLGVADASTFGPGVGCAWLLTTHLVDSHPKAFLRACRKARALFLAHYNALVNLVDARYLKALRWARWLGFEVGGPIEAGAEARAFYPVVLRRQAWAEL